MTPVGAFDAQRLIEIDDPDVRSSRARRVLDDLEDLLLLRPLG